MPTPLTHPARTELETFNRKHPGIWQAVAEARVRAEWPENVFLPAFASADILETLDKSIARKGVAFAQEFLTLGMFAAWRTTQGIYRFDPDIYSTVCATPMESQIPVEVLEHLPEWCVYIETPGMKWLTGGKLIEQLGAWVWLDWRRNPPALLTLSFGMHLPMGICFSQLSLSKLTVEQSMIEMEHVVESMGGPWAVAGTEPSLAARQKGQFYASQLKPLLPLVLYLCTMLHDIGDGRRIPQRPQLRRTKGLERITPPPQPVEWNVGVRMGTALRRAKSWADAQVREAEADGRRTVRPHFRSAHWAIRWIGRMNGERKAVVRWIPPTLVNARSPDELPSVIRPVRGSLGRQRRA